MQITTQSSKPLQTIFGGGYVFEQHRDETHSNLSSSDVGGVIGSMTVLMIDEVIKSLRSALSLR
ncbi:MAG: hypothetical protein NTV56_18640 [Alphaproteobacteria bacterium]|nr:hypothetical protein [Alphaproteobacteria bacterium]